MCKSDADTESTDTKSADKKPTGTKSKVYRLLVYKVLSGGEGGGVERFQMIACQPVVEHSLPGYDCCDR